jgi:outer membrane protein
VAEVHTLTLSQALDLAAKQNPDVLLSRLDARRAEQGILIARDPFVPKVTAGSGLAYTYGYPSSIDGNAPSVIQARTTLALYNRPDDFLLAQARENARGALVDVQSKSEEVAFRVSTQYLDVMELSKQVDVLSQQEPSLVRVADSMDARVAEGSELPVESKRAKVNLASMRQRLDAAKSDLDYSQRLLALAVGFPEPDRVQTVEAPQQSANIAVQSEEQAVELALKNNPSIQRLQSASLSKELEIHAQQAQRRPQVNLVAQYALFAKYNYKQYFTKFQYNNLQVGVEIIFPILVGSATRGISEQATTDIAKLRVQMNDTRSRTATNARRSYQEWKKAEAARDVARLQLDLAREDLSVLIAQLAEGRALMSRVEQARVAENDRWLMLYTAEASLERARLGLLKDTGTLVATLHSDRKPSQP